jgi:hypothetical protein
MLRKGLELVGFEFDRQLKVKSKDAPDQLVQLIVRHGEIIPVATTDRRPPTAAARVVPSPAAATMVGSPLLLWVQQPVTRWVRRGQARGVVRRRGSPRDGQQRSSARRGRKRGRPRPCVDRTDSTRLAGQTRVFHPIRRRQY